MGEFPEISWHKQEKEHILKVLGIEVEYGEEIDYGADKGSFKTMSDHEHVEIIADYVQGYSQGDIAAIRRRSPATVNKQIRQHNNQVERVDHCPRCKRVDGEHFNKMIRKVTVINQ